MNFQKLALCISLCIVALCGAAQTQLYTSNVTSSAARLNWSYDLTPAEGIYYGAYSSDMDLFVTDAGKQVSIRHKYQAWGSSWNAFPTNTMNDIRLSGAIPLVTWEPWAYKITDANYTLAHIINGTYDQYIAQWAAAAKSWKHPFFLRFAHEMNGRTWYPWQEGFNGNTPGQFVQAWKHIVDIFREQGVNNVNWVWCPNVSFYNSTPMAGLYPGDDYVDWVALDGYNRSTSSSNWKTFQAVYNNSFNELEQIAPDKNIMIAEISSSETGGSKGDWIRDAFGTQIPARAKVKAVVWFNSIDVFDFRIQSSAAAQDGFREAIGSTYYSTNNFSSIGALSYEVRYRPEHETGWVNAVSPSYSLDLSGLAPSTTYEYQVRALTANGYSNYSASSFFTTDEVVTSIGEQMPKPQFGVFPNPFEGSFNINVTTPQQVPLKIEIVDVRGALVHTSNDRLTNEKITTGETLSAGLYFVRLEAAGHTEVIKLIKGE